MRVSVQCIEEEGLKPVKVCVSINMGSITYKSTYFFYKLYYFLYTLVLIRSQLI